IELRICAEDASADFRPAIGDILLLDEPRGEGVRVDSGILDGGKVTTDFDPMLSKLIVHGRDRDEAIARGRRAAQDYVILGVTTNLSYLDAILAHPKFCSGEVSTGFLSEEAEALKQDCDPASTDILAAATVLSDARLVKALEDVPEIYRIMGNWRN
ncbi:biotin carboxylase, partial [Aliiroseovarius sp. PTFE2010]